MMTPDTPEQPATAKTQPVVLVSVEIDLDPTEAVYLRVTIARCQNGFIWKLWDRVSPLRLALASGSATTLEQAKAEAKKSAIKRLREAWENLGLEIDSIADNFEWE